VDDDEAKMCAYACSSSAAACLLVRASYAASDVRAASLQWPWRASPPLALGVLAALYRQWRPAL
jgi:hypothetical protein